MRIRRTIGMLLMGVLIIVSACSEPAPATPSTTTPGPTLEPEMIMGYAEVVMPGRSFNPDAITIGAGTTVTWVNKDGEHHTITSDIPGLFNGTVGPFDSFSYTFNERGDFEYYCGVYGQMGMRGVVHVR